jgi:hypothetical protein
MLAHGQCGGSKAPFGEPIEVAAWAHEPVPACLDSLRGAAAGADCVLPCLETRSFSPPLDGWGGYAADARPTDVAAGTPCQPILPLERQATVPEPRRSRSPVRFMVWPSCVRGTSGTRCRG